MSNETQDVCLNCRRSEEQIPLTTWRYQGQELWICCECTPLIIHQKEKLLAKWQAAQQPETGA